MLKKYALPLALVCLSSCAQLNSPQHKALTMTAPIQENPDYVVINNEEQSEDQRAVLRTPAQKVRFPLNKEDKRLLDILVTKYDGEENIAGLAAPQVGIPKQMIVFAALDDPELKKWRPDLVQTMDKTIWINPTYDGIGDDKHEDYEGCFSVHDLAGPVKRFTKIRYAATLPDGTNVTGEAEGFLARIIQHEVDHLNSTLCIDLMPKDKILTLEEYRQMRADRVEASSDDDSNQEPS